MSGSPKRHRFTPGLRRFLGVAGLVVLILVAYLVLTASHSHVAASPEVQSIYILDSGGLRYTYQVVTDTEGLFDLGADPRCLTNLAPSRPERTIQLRLQLLSDLRLESFDELRQKLSPAIERLRGLGYL